MRISLATETFFPQVNGVSRALENLVRSLLEQGDEIQLLTPKYRAETGTPPGPEVTRQDCFHAIPAPFYPEILVPVIRPGGVAACLRKFEPDIVHIATEGTLGLHTLKAVRRLRLPAVSSYHTNFSMYTASYRLPWLASALWKYLRWFHNATSATFCPTPSIRDELLRQRFQRVKLWGRGVDSALFNPARRSSDLRRHYGVSDDHVLLLCVGRLANEKNMDMLLDAVVALGAPEQTKLLLVGDGPLREHLQDRGLSNVIFAGYHRGEDLAAHYASADVMVFPSLSETFGNVVLEAMASGLPVVGFDAPGPRDIIRHGDTGLVVKQVTAAAFAEPVAKLVREHALRRALGTNARAYAETRTWTNINRVVRDEYANVLAARQGAESARSDCPVKTAV